MKKTAKFILKGLLLAYAVFALSCSNTADNDTSDESTGSVSLGLVWNTHADEATGDDGVYSPAELVINDDGTIDCNQSDADKIFVTIYNQSDNRRLADNGEGWDCDHHEGIVENVSAGSNRKFVCYVSDISSNVLYRGQESDVTVEPGSAADGNNHVQIEMNPFTCDLSTPEDDATVETYTPVFEWDAVQYAGSYQFQLAADTNFDSIVVNETLQTNQFTPTTQITASGTYYWRVRAIDPHGLEGAWSTPCALSIFFPTPTVNSTTPADNDVNVSVNSAIMAVFSELMDGSTISVTTFKVNDGTTDIAGTVALDGDGITAVFTTSASLETDRIYTATITTGVRSRTGQAPAQDFVWSFATTDTVLPTVIDSSLFPHNGARGVGIYPTIKATFSESMDPATFTSNTFRIQDQELNDISGTITFDDETWTVSFLPDQNLPCDERIAVTIAVQVEDTAGNPLTSEKQWQFTTTDRCGVQIAAGYNHSLAIKSDGTLWAWGDNIDYQLGDGTYEDKDTPTLIGDSTDNDWAFVTGGQGHSLAIKTDGTLWAWGNNYKGQLGDGTGTGFGETPTLIGDSTDNDWAFVDAGMYHSLAVKTDGALWAWGNNACGVVGDGTDAVMRVAPTLIGDSTDSWAYVAAGSSHNLAIKSDGTLWAWGCDDFQQLGNGADTEMKNTPTLIGDSTDSWAFVAAGYGHSLAIKSDGTLWAWGTNTYGQIGDGTFNTRNTPTPIGNDNDWAYVAAGYLHSMAKKTDGTLWTWGYNYDGQLGDGTDMGGRIRPTRIGDSTNNDWAFAAAGFRHNLAIKNDGTLWAWGHNFYGQLGDGTDGTDADKNTPTLIGDFDE